jgi:Holliday junction resolvase RusA-like endonuclease
VALHFIIPGRPTAWQRAGGQVVNKRTGKLMRLNPQGMKEKQDAIAWAAKAALRGSAPMTGPLRLELLCVYAVPPSWPSWKRAAALVGEVWKTSTPDHDNLTKQVGDALNGVAFVDDAQIVRSSVAKRYGQPERTEVRISRVDGL